MVKAKDLMTKNVVTVSHRQTIKDVVQKMIDSDVRCMPVVNGKKFVGLISHGDLLKQIVLEGLSDFSQVVGLMKTNNICVEPNTDAKKLMETVSQYNLRRIPVVDKKNNLLGLITQTDIIKYSTKELRKKSKTFSLKKK